MLCAIPVHLRELQVVEVNPESSTIVLLIVHVTLQDVKSRFSAPSVLHMHGYARLYECVVPGEAARVNLKCCKAMSSADIKPSACPFSDYLFSPLQTAGGRSGKMYF